MREFQMEDEGSLRIYPAYFDDQCGGNGHRKEKHNEM